MKSVNIDVQITIIESNGNKIKVSIGGHDLKHAQKWIEFMEQLILADRESSVDTS